MTEIDLELVQFYINCISILLCICNNLTFIMFFSTVQFPFLQITILPFHFPHIQSTHNSCLIPLLFHFLYLINQLLHVHRLFYITHIIIIVSDIRGVKIGKSLRNPSAVCLIIVRWWGLVIVRLVANFRRLGCITGWVVDDW